MHIGHIIMISLLESTPEFQTPLRRMDIDSKMCLFVARLSYHSQLVTRVNDKGFFLSRNVAQS